MIVIEVTYELTYQINEAIFLRTFREHVKNVQSFSPAVQPVVFNLGDSRFPAFVVQYHFKSDSESEFEQFEKKLHESVNSDFTDEMNSALKKSFRALVPWPDMG